MKSGGPDEARRRPPRSAGRPDGPDGRGRWTAAPRRRRGARARRQGAGKAIRARPADRPSRDAGKSFGAGRASVGRRARPRASAKPYGTGAPLLGGPRTRRPADESGGEPLRFMPSEASAPRRSRGWTGESRVSASGRARPSLRRRAPSRQEQGCPGGPGGRAGDDRRADRRGHGGRGRNAGGPLPGGALSGAVLQPHPAHRPQGRAAGERQAGRDRRTGSWRGRRSGFRRCRWTAEAAGRAPRRRTRRPGPS